MDHMFSHFTFSSNTFFIHIFMFKITHTICILPTTAIISNNTVHTVESVSLSELLSTSHLLAEASLSKIAPVEEPQELLETAQAKIP